MPSSLHVPVLFLALLWSSTTGAYAASEVDANHAYAQTVQRFLKARRSGDSKALQSVLADDSRIWFDEKSGPGRKRTTDGAGPWVDWDGFFRSRSDIQAYQLDGNSLRTTVTEINDWYHLVERPASTYYITYWFGTDGRIEGTLIHSLEDTPERTDRKTEFEAWARENHSGLLEELMPGGEIDPALDKARKWKEMLLAWRQDAGLPNPLEPTVAKARTLLGQQKFAEAADLMDQLTQQEPENGQAWMLKGYAYHAMKDYERALPAHLKATTFEGVASNAMYNAACAYALLGNLDESFVWLEKVHALGKTALTGVLLDDELKELHEDPRLKKLLPSAQDYADPFQEEYRVIHEWVGEGKGDEYGWIARNVGDVDGDGVNDLTTSAPSYGGGQQGAGRVYTYSGKDGALLWTATGEAGARLGLGIEAAGDVNADGVPDVVAGAPGANRAYVYSGIDGAVLLELEARHEGEGFGGKVSDLGDVDGDGHDDVLVGAPDNGTAGEGAGRAYVISGKDGSDILVLMGQEPGDAFGSSGGGVRKGDHLFIAVGAPGAGEGDRGRTYVYKDLSGEPAFIIESDQTGVSLGGMFVSVVGDVNADGTPDIYASDWSNAAKGRSTGRVYVHSGETGERLYTFTGEEAGDGFGIGVADCGDVDGDGHDDLLIGAWQHASGAPSGGKTYLYAGKDGSLMREWTCKVPGDTFGFDTTGMGDVDGDGSIDFLITSAWSAVEGARSGRMFVLSGAGTPTARADR